MPNIGKVLSEKLGLVGIEEANDLKSVGAEDVFIRLFTIDKNSCLNMLYAIEGAIQETRWHNLYAERKNQLEKFYKTVKN